MPMKRQRRSAGRASSSCGSGLARDRIDADCLTERGACIASKPLPQGIAAYDELFYDNLSLTKN